MFFQFDTNYMRHKMSRVKFVLDFMPLSVTCLSLSSDEIVLLVKCSKSCQNPQIEHVEPVLSAPSLSDTYQNLLSFLFHWTCC